MTTLIDRLIAAGHDVSEAGHYAKYLADKIWDAGCDDKKYERNVRHSVSGTPVDRLFVGIERLADRGWDIVLAEIAEYIAGRCPAGLAAA